MGKLNARARIIQDYEIVLDNGRPHAVIVDPAHRNLSRFRTDPA